MKENTLNIERVSMIPRLPLQVQAFYHQAEEDYESFWEKAALDASGDVHWFHRWDQVFNWQYPTFQWYSGGTTNICYNCLDLKIEQGRGDKLAFIAESGDSGEKTSVTYNQLLRMVEQVAAALRGIGVQKGNRVAVYLPMSIEAAVSMLACARIGAVHMVIFAGFSSGAIADRLDLAGA
jgi:acetyl-CoA synthetase